MHNFLLCPKSIKLHFKFILHNFGSPNPKSSKAQISKSHFLTLDLFAESRIAEFQFTKWDSENWTSAKWNLVDWQDTGFVTWKYRYIVFDISIYRSRYRCIVSYHRKNVEFFDISWYLLYMSRYFQYIAIFYVRS